MGLIERWLKTLIRRGIREGLLAGNGMWVAVGALAWLVRFLRQKPGETLIVERIRPGETLTITSVPPPPTGRQLRKLPRPERKQAKATRDDIALERKRATPRPKGGATPAE